eukprot:300232-Chlamydomonas_euryale.AAC.2
MRTNGDEAQAMVRLLLQPGRGQPSKSADCRQPNLGLLSNERTVFQPGLGLLSYKHTLFVLGLRLLSEQAYLLPTRFGASLRASTPPSNPVSTLRCVLSCQRRGKGGKVRAHVAESPLRTFWCCVLTPPCKGSPGRGPVSTWRSSSMDVEQPEASASADASPSAAARKRHAWGGGAEKLVWGGGERGAGRVGPHGGARGRGERGAGRVGPHGGARGEGNGV